MAPGRKDWAALVARVVRSRLLPFLAFNVSIEPLERCCRTYNIVSLHIGGHRARGGGYSFEDLLTDHTLNKKRSNKNLN